MPNTLLQFPYPYTVMEWRYAFFIEPLTDLARKTGIFETLGNGPLTAEQLAEKTHLSQRGVLCLCRCLTAAGMFALEGERFRLVTTTLPEEFKTITAATRELRDSIEKGIFKNVAPDGTLPPDAPRSLVTLGIARQEGEQLVLTDPGRAYFTPGEDFYLGNYVLQGLGSLPFFLDKLEGVVKTGQRLVMNDARFFASVVDTLFLMNFAAAQRLANYLENYFKGQERTSALDLGAGSGVWGIQLALQSPRFTVTAFDSAHVLERTRAYVGRYQVDSQFIYQPIDFTAQDDWGAEPYDVIYLCHFCAGVSEEENQRIISNCARHLREGGCLVIVDFIPDENWSGPLLDILFALQMLFVTPYSGPYTLSSIEKWCRNADLVNMEKVSLPGAAASALVISKSR